jgi:hypothetical protein
MTLQEFQQRVLDEKKDLDDKLDKLKAFINTDEKFLRLSVGEQLRLERQAEIMQDYSDVLTERIASFTENSSVYFI